jgi:RimJ/RimL family protein N-acetyltransferase
VADDRLIPLEHPIPPGFEAGSFVLRPITIHDVIRDYDAVNSSTALLRSRFHEAWGWPPDEPQSIEDAMIELAWHQKEGELRRSFNYLIASPDEKRALGCVYVDPPEDDDGHDVWLDWWVREDEPRSLEAEVEAAVREWIAAEWPFSNPRWPDYAQS